MLPDIAASVPIADMLLNAEESWLQRLSDPSAPLPPTDQRYDGGLHDLNTPVKNLWVKGLISIVGYSEDFELCFFQIFFSYSPLLHPVPPSAMSFPTPCLYTSVTQEPPGYPYL